jgi:hypothetical protein
LPRAGFKKPLADGSIFRVGEGFESFLDILYWHMASAEFSLFRVTVLPWTEQTHWFLFGDLVHSGEVYRIDGFQPL